MANGLPAALRVLAAMVADGRRASEMLNAFDPVPQRLVNIRLPRDAGDVLHEGAVRDAIAQAEKDLDGQGRVLVRKSGTEPVVRVVVECLDAARAEACGEMIARCIRGAAQA